MLLNLNQLRGTLSQFNDYVFSLYLYVDNARRENQADNPAWRIELKNAISQITNGDITDTASPARGQLIEKQLNQFFKDYHPRGKSLVVFADGEHLFSEELSIPLESQSYHGKPMIFPLLWALNEYKRYLIVQVDREQARFISAHLGRLNVEAEMEIDLDSYDFGPQTMVSGNMSAVDGGIHTGNDRERFDAMIDAHVRRFHRDVIERTSEIANKLETDRIIVSGNKHAAKSLHDMITGYLLDRVIGVVPAPLNIPEHKVLSLVVEAAREYERKREYQLIQDVVNAARAKGRGALGHDEVLNMLQQQRVETLIIPYPPTMDILTNEFRQKAFESGIAIELVHGAPAEILHKEGGVAARLYYAL